MATSNIRFRNFFLALAAVITLNLTSCSANDEPDPMSEYGDEANVTDVTVTYEYSVPEELLNYVEIRPCVNNDAATDMLPWQAMNEPKVSHTYHVSKFPMETIFVAEFQNLMSKASGVNVDWTLSMEITVSMKVDGKPVYERFHVDYPLYGDLWNAIYTLAHSPLDRTFAVKVWKNGSWKFRQ